MKVLNVKQGSKEWLEARRKHFTASEAQAMMGASKYQTRDELLREKAIGITPEIDAATQRLFEEGHSAEKSARAITEQIIGEELYPVTGVSDEHPKLLASFDGLNLMGDTIFEHKLWNEGLAEAVKRGEVPPTHYWQLEHQLLVSGAERVIFVVSDGTKEKRVECEYRAVPGRREALLRGWEQFEQDLKGYKPVPVKVEPVANPIDSLPALSVQITGGVTRSNLDEYKTIALRFIDSINTDLRTDQDFADADALVKFCSKAEKELDSVKDAALAQTQDIADLFRAIDDLKARMRSKRLELNKLVTARKQAIREEIAARAKQDWFDFINAKQIAGVNLASIIVAPDFGAAMRNKRTIKSLQSSVNHELARAKIEAMKVIDDIQANIALIDHVAGDLKSVLCPDIMQIITKPHDDLHNLLMARKAEYEEREQKRIEAERKRIEEQERKKIEAERAEQERRERIAVEQAAEATRKNAECRNAENMAEYEREGPIINRAAKPKNDAFEKWWKKEGSGIRPEPDEDMAEFARRIALIAWQNGERYSMLRAT